MKQRDPSEPSRLLEDLESIRTLLDEHPEPEVGEDGQLDIPLLQDVILNPDEPPLSAIDRPAPPLTSGMASKSPNPFLPYASLAKLAEERMQLDQIMAQQSPLTAVPSSPREARLEARLQAEAQLLLQEVIYDLMPTIEDELRKRMQGKLQQLVREQLK